MIKEESFLASSLLLALDDEKSAKYRDDCLKNGKEIDYTKINGLSHETLFSYFYEKTKLLRKTNGWEFEYFEKDFIGGKLDFDLINSENGKVYAKKGEKFNALISKNLKSDSVKKLFIDDESILGSFLSNDIFDEKTGIIYFESGDEVTENTFKYLKDKDIKILEILKINSNSHGSYIRDTFNADKNKNRNDAVTEIYKILRPGEPPTLEAADKLFKSLFFDRERYDLSLVGRLKLNTRLNLDAKQGQREFLRIMILYKLSNIWLVLKDGFGHIDDIDHLGNRRVRSVGELLENQYTLGVIRMERAIKERMTNAPDIETVMPNDLVNPKPASAAIREFFGQSQLSQFMDQTNPLSEITHKRRLSALGPGGLSRERAGFEVKRCSSISLWENLSN